MLTASIKQNTKCATVVSFNDWNHEKEKQQQQQQRKKIFLKSYIKKHTWRRGSIGPRDGHAMQSSFVLQRNMTVFYDFKKPKDINCIKEKPYYNGPFLLIKSTVLEDKSLWLHLARMEVDCKFLKNAAFFLFHNSHGAENQKAMNTFLLLLTAGKK